MLKIVGNILELDKDFNCGYEEIVEYYIFKNNSYGFGNFVENFFFIQYNNNVSFMNVDIVNKGLEMLLKV